MLITQNDIEEIRKKCEQFQVKYLYLFGSAATDKFDLESDIDLLVDFEEVLPEQYIDHYYNLKDYLAGYFQRNIDLLESKALKNKYLIESINKNKFLIYGKEY
jgi:uncharacterized protein